MLVIFNNTGKIHAAYYILVFCYTNNSESVNRWINTYNFSQKVCRGGSVRPIRFVNVPTFDPIWFWDVSLLIAWLNACKRPARLIFVKSNLFLTNVYKILGKALAIKIDFMTDMKISKSRERTRLNFFA